MGTKNERRQKETERGGRGKKGKKKKKGSREKEEALVLFLHPSVRHTQLTSFFGQVRSVLSAHTQNKKKSTKHRQTDRQ